jgi:BirA family transcriptional regulator, biotin operon repressor / biotin---[acetyl-CoA-carboxylase] ligase
VSHKTNMSPLDLELLRRLLPSREIVYCATLDSTMRAAAGRPLGTVVLAEQQTAGQGRYGRSWHSETGTGIYVSIVLRPARLLTMALGLAAVEAITAATGIACDLRWPNDVMAGGSKVAGILVQLADNESRTRERAAIRQSRIPPVPSVPGPQFPAPNSRALPEAAAIAGIGINVNQTAFPAELADSATSLRMIAGRELSRTDILLALIPAAERCTQLPVETILRLFAQASSYARGRRVVVEQPDGIVQGVTAGLTDAGYLRVRQDDGTDTLIVAGGVRAIGAGRGE